MHIVEVWCHDGVIFQKCIIVSSPGGTALFSVLFSPAHLNVLRLSRNNLQRSEMSLHPDRCLSAHHSHISKYILRVWFSATEKKNYFIKMDHNSSQAYTKRPAWMHRGNHKHTHTHTHTQMFLPILWSFPFHPILLPCLGRLVW